MLTYESMAEWFSPKFRDWVRRELLYADVAVDHRKFLGFAFSFGIALAFAVAMDLFLVFDYNPLYGFAATFAGFDILLYVILFLMAQGRSKFIEDVLPDALQLMSSNIRAGITTDRALLLSARPEFGPLSKEIALAGKRIFAGGVVEDELVDMTKRIRSKVLERTVYLIVQSIKSGGELGRLLIQTADDLRNQESIRKEIEATVLVYSILILFSVGLAAPFLWKISLQPKSAAAIW